jgi:hypothetical protein
MQTIKLHVEDAFYAHFMALIESLSKDKKVEIVHNDFPEQLLVRTVKEVQTRIQSAQKSETISEKQYDENMNLFFKNNFGMTR